MMFAVQKSGTHSESESGPLSPIWFPIHCNLTFGRLSCWAFVLFLKKLDLLLSIVKMKCRVLKNKKQHTTRILIYDAYVTLIVPVF